MPILPPCGVPAIPMSCGVAGEPLLSILNKVIVRITYTYLHVYRSVHISILHKA